MEEEAAKRIELLVKKRVEEELEKRKDEIEQEVAKRVEEAKRKMEKEMMEELERQREQQRREELARQVTAAPLNSHVQMQLLLILLLHMTRITVQQDLFSPLMNTISTFQCYMSTYKLKKKLIKVLFRSYLLKVQSGVVRVLTRILFVKS